jgi:hypothetical protein
LRVPAILIGPGVVCDTTHSRELIARLNFERF